VTIALQLVSEPIQVSVNLCTLMADTVIIIEGGKCTRYLLMGFFDG
jgi:hypothetical protein